MNTNTEEYQKDYSLLRPFDLEKAKNGNLLCNIYDEYTYKLLSYTMNTNEELLSVQVEVVKGIPHQYNVRDLTTLKMKPLAWVEGKPVYKGDILYSKVIKGFDYLVDSVSERGDIISYSSDYLGRIEEPCNLTWNKPKQKKSKKVWVNIYPNNEVGNTYNTKKDAICNAKCNVVTTIEVEINWEE